MAQKPVPPEERLKLIGFRLHPERNAAIEAKAAELGMGKAQLLRYIVETFLDADPEVAA